MNMTSFLKILMLAMVFLIPVRLEAEDLGALRLSRIQGDVQIQSKGSDEWFPAAVNLPIQPGDRLWVPEEARAQVENREGSVLRIDAESSLEILAMEPDSMQVYLDSGQTYVHFQSHDDFMLQLDTPVASLRVYEGSTFNVRLGQDGYAEVSVFDGAVAAEVSSGEIMVDAGRMFFIDDGVPALMALGASSEWERWNREKDQALAEKGRDDQYLPPELSFYGRDLRENGRWVSTPEYGYVWTPTMHISVDWAPYRHGRWVWIGNDYVWIGSEPWGWAPYHYGRWSYISSFGWCWVPPRRNEVYWGPGYVSWIQTSSDVAWVPLAPGEFYYGHGYYGPHSVNTIGMSLSIVIPGKNFRNARVRDAVTVVHRDAFLSGRYRDGRRRDNPFLRESIHLGRPRLEPQRITRMPSIREIPRDKHPPASISRSGRSLDGGRPMVRERDRSVFSPSTGVQPLSLPVRTMDSRPQRSEEREKDRSRSFRDRREFPERGVMPGSPERTPPIKGEERRERRPSAPLTEETSASAVPHVAPAPVTEQPVQPVQTEKKEQPAKFRDRPQDVDQENRQRPFRNRPDVNRNVDPQPTAQPAPAQPQVSAPVEVLPPPVSEQRMQTQEREQPSMFRGRPQGSDQGERQRPSRDRSERDQDVRPQPTAQPVPAQPQVSAPVEVVPPPVREQRMQAQEREQPSMFRGRPQGSDQGERQRPSRDRSERDKDVRPQPTAQPVPAQPQVAAPPPQTQSPRQSVQPDGGSGKRRQHRQPDEQKDEENKSDEDKLQDPMSRGRRH